ncbi:MAG: hypothetical protein OHK0039_35470 [Bacteroidia bacterium]
MQKSLIVCLFWVLSLGLVRGQGQQGQVTFVTSRNVYVGFAETGGIEAGDTLHLQPADVPCLLVTNKSSTSVVCVPLGDCVVVKGMQVAARPGRSVAPEPVPEKPAPTIEETPREEPPSAPTRPAEVIRARVAASAYNTIGSERDDRHQVLGQVFLNADHIAHSGFSLEAHGTYRQIFPTDTARFDPQTRFLRLYNLALRYQGGQGTRLSLGRRIDPRIASLGALDGLQVEQQWGQGHIGAIVGSRPDIRTHALNPDLLAYGAYVGWQHRGKDSRSETTLGIIEQRNRRALDRRYAYFQHNSSLSRQLLLFASGEVDLYQRIDGVAGGDLRLSNLYTSITYRPDRRLSLMLSYDSRKQILYYETLQTEIERLLEDDLARQGVRLRLNLRPLRGLQVGASYSKRFQSDTQNRSDNVHGYVSATRLPWIGGRLSATYNRNASNYLITDAGALRHSRELLSGKAEAELYCRLVRYRFGEGTTNRLQHYAGTQVQFRFSRTCSLGVSGEFSTFNGERNYRLYTRLVKRFHRLTP